MADLTRKPLGGGPIWSADTFGSADVYQSRREGLQSTPIANPRFAAVIILTIPSLQAPYFSSPWNRQEVCVPASRFQDTNTPAVMILIDILGAAHAARQRINPRFNMSGLPDLRASSDILWGMWQCSVQSGSLKALRWLFVLNILNTDAKQIIRRALDSKKETLKQWPGVRFSWDEEAGQALLGVLLKLDLGVWC